MKKSVDLKKSVKGLFPFTFLCQAVEGVELMDEKLLDEDLEKMQPYLAKWYKDHCKMSLTSPYKTLQYEVIMEGFAPLEDMLCQSYFYSILEAFRELVKTYYYAQAAHKIEIELKEKDEKNWSNYWKFEVKNYHFRTVIPRIIALLDYVAVMINELSRREIIKEERKVYFDRFKSLLRNRKTRAGWLSFEEIKELNRILSPIYQSISQEDRRMLKYYRNTTTHRYFVGIDELSVPLKRRDLSKTEQRKFDTEKTYVYRMHTRPEYTFDILNTLAQKMLNNLDEMLFGLIQMDIMKNSLNKRRE